MNILCRLGWHRWKPVVRADWARNHFLMRGRIYSPVAHKCTRCGKRRAA